MGVEREVEPREVWDHFNDAHEGKLRPARYGEVAEIPRHCECRHPWLGVNGKCRACGRRIMAPRYAEYLHDLKRGIDAYLARASYEYAGATIVKDCDGWHLRVDPGHWDGS